MINKILQYFGITLMLAGVVYFFVLFPGSMVDGAEFESQAGSGFSDYSAGDVVLISDQISRIESENGQTHIWLSSSGSSESDLLLTFNADLSGDLGLNQAVIISGTFVSSGSGLTLEGYDTSVQALSEDSIMKKGQTMNERGSLGAIFFGLVLFIFARVKMRSAGKKRPMAPVMSPVAAPLPPQPVAAQAAAQLQPAPVAEPFVIGCPRCSVGIQVNDPQRPLKINCPNCQTGLVVN